MGVFKIFAGECTNVILSIMMVWAQAGREKRQYVARCQCRNNDDYIGKVIFPLICILDENPIGVCVCANAKVRSLITNNFYSSVLLTLYDICITSLS